MPAGVAGAPQPNTIRIDCRMALQIGDPPAPVGNLPPRVPLIARFAIAVTEPSVVVHQHHESRLGKHAGESVQPVLAHSGIPVGPRGTTVRTGPHTRETP